MDAVDSRGAHRLGRRQHDTRGGLGRRGRLLVYDDNAEEHDGAIVRDLARRARRRLLDRKHGRLRNVARRARRDNNLRALRRGHDRRQKSRLAFRQEGRVRRRRRPADYSCADNFAGAVKQLRQIRKKRPRGLFFISRARCRRR